MINIDNIPQELKDLNMWAVHSNKRPFSSKLNNGNLQGTNYTDGNLWASLDDCVPLIGKVYPQYNLSLIHISEPTRLLSISYAVFCLKKKKKS